MYRCLRCKKEEAAQPSRWCPSCYYPGIDANYDEYLALLDEGHRQCQAAVMSGWQDPVEAGCESD